MLMHYTSTICLSLQFADIFSFWFQTLAKCRSEVCKELGMAEEKCDLSMGMSGDFELAVSLLHKFLGST